ncbi:MAG: hypothetical protein NDI84_12440 [Steroidobacteraceae bacterium]|nr:hypothetical protein [Steroidobacteraceae bacterium]
MTQSTRLPDAWVKSLLDRMAAMYGEKFVRQWEKTDPDAMRDMWAESLGRFDGDQIKWALQHLVGNNPFPPTLPEFVMLCRQAPRKETPALPAPVVPKSVAQRRAEELAQAAEKITGAKKDPKGWAREVLAEPKKFPGISVKFARMALGASDA